MNYTVTAIKGELSVSSIMVDKLATISIILGFAAIMWMVFVSNTPPKHPYAHLTVEQLIEKHEYPVEVHQVSTEDGYILTLHRIPHGIKKSPPQKQIPVLMVPGLGQTSWDFVSFGPNRSLSFLLAERGFDVWMGNVRSSTWSRKHTVLDPDKDKSFWNFSVHEIGKYDIPAFIDYILNSTKEQSLHYVGYSQGTAAFFIMGSERRNYTKKIKLFTSIAPAIFIQNPKSKLVKYMGEFWKIQEALFSILNLHELFNKGGVVSKYFQYTCHENSFFLNICLHNMFLIFGYSYDEIDTSYLSLTMANMPGGTSTRQLLHLLQWIQSGEFRQYDYGTEGNLEKYGQKEPPNYNFLNNTTPVALYYTSNDGIINIKNIDKLTAELPNVVKKYQVPSDTFNHYDFFSGKNVVDLLYNAIISEMLLY